MENKSKKLTVKIISTLMVLLLTFSAVPFVGGEILTVSAAEDTEYTKGNYIYTVDNKKATIVSTDGELRGSVKIPSKLGGYPVTAIGDMAFMLNTYITDVVIPDSVESIGASAFDSCFLLRSVKIGKGVKDIIGNPFTDCELLSKLEVSAENKYFSSDKFGVLFNKRRTALISFPSGISVAEYTVPDGVEKIGASSFANNTKITAVHLPSSVNEIGSMAFSSCLSLKNITGPDTLYKIGLDAFSETPWFTAEPNSLVYFGKVLCGFNGDGLSPLKIEIAEGTLGIADGALAAVTDTQELIIPSSLIYIGEGSVVSAGLKKITVNPANAKFAADASGVLYTKDMKKLVAYPSSAPLSVYSVSGKTETIGTGAFGAAMYLLELRLPASVKKIEDAAFAAAMSLEKIKMSKNITEIGEGAFTFCMSLKSITIPDGVKKIKDGTFMFCTGLTSVKFGKNIVSIGDMAFSGCSALKKITLGGKIKTIGEDAFSSCSGLTSVTLGKNVKTLKGNPFSGCEKLKSFSVDTNNKYFSADGYGVLFNKKATKLLAYPVGRKDSTYSVPKTVTAIGAYAFRSAEKLKNISLSEKTKTIGDYAFADCLKLKSVNLINVRSIGEYAFDYCENLENVYFSAKITSIGAGAFEGCEELSDVYYAGTKKEWKKVKIAKYESLFGEDNPLDEAEKHFSHKHTYGKGKTTAKSTYVRNGFKTYTCSKCGCIKSTDISKLKLKKTEAKTLKSNKKKQITLTWSPVNDASGYLVKYSSSEKFSEKTTKSTTIAKQNTTKKTVKNLKSGKKYFVKIRAYKTVSGSKVYGPYSKVLSVKVK
ncbi:MAG: leucine-rich repeat protein [Clostridia bacterium]|nr:leucine-rich repeat protein [Clostridia bacterium]